MRYNEIQNEGAAIELARKLPSLAKHDYDTIDKLMHKISKKHKISANALHDIFLKKYKKTPDDWIKNKLDETDTDNDLDIEQEIDKFVDWTCKRLHIKNKPNIILSNDTEDAQKNHHTGRHIGGTNDVWVYVKNRNLVDILRTIAHELTHIRQDELNMIKLSSSYPGSPIELLADMVAGKLIKLYGKRNHHIFQ